jgi:hypothetical protein
VGRSKPADFHHNNLEFSSHSRVLTWFVHCCCDDSLWHNVLTTDDHDTVSEAMIGHNSIFFILTTTNTSSVR